MFRTLQFIAITSLISVLGIAGELAEPVAAENMISQPAPSRAWLAEQKAFLENREPSRPNKMWKASLVALFAASAVDIHSSLGKRELNPLLKGADGRFSAQGIAIKAAITGGAAAAQWFLVRRNPDSAKYAAIANFGMSGMFTAAAVNNYGNRKAAPGKLK
jgi:hypothetical protein